MINLDILIGELRWHKLYGAAKKKKKNLEIMGERAL